jgi:hypothetical protein
LQIFSKVKEQQPKGMEKVTAVTGDITMLIRYRYILKNWYVYMHPSGRALVAAPVWVLSYINRLFGGTDLSKCVLFQYFLFPSILCSILCGQLCILLLCVFRLVQFILWSHLSSHCHHPLYAGGTVSLWALELQARPPLLPEATRSFLPRNQRSRHRRVAYTSRL